MAQFASYDPAGASPQPVIGWYDTAAAEYANLPPTVESMPAGFLAVSSDQWSAHLADLRISAWTIVGGALVHSP